MENVITTPVIKKTKIVATVGPATNKKSIIQDMIEAGVDVFRINFSHAGDNYDEIIRIIEIIKKERDLHRFSVGILADLQGPKLRTGIMKENVEVKEGDDVLFITGKAFEGDATKVYMNYKKFPEDVNVGERFLIDDGKLIFEVVETDKKESVKARVIQGGSLKSKKGVNLPNTKVSLPALTEKDIRDVLFAIKLKVDWIALSFVRCKEDIEDLKKIIATETSDKIPIIAKIEKPEALKNIDEIIAHSGGLMVARGDLGVEIPSYEVPLKQKMLVRKAKAANIPVIVATQMMESMIVGLTPSRAEINDVANSIIDGADAVMLSGETSVGKYPVQVVENMSSIVRSVENSEYASNMDKYSLKIDNRERFITDSICYHAAKMAKEYKSVVISTLTNSGYTAYKISSWRPKANILVFTSNKHIINQLSLLWGVQAYYYDKFVSTDETIRDVNIFACKKGYIKPKDMLISLAAMPLQEKGMVNTIRVTKVETCNFDNK